MKSPVQEKFLIVGPPGGVVTKGGPRLTRVVSPDHSQGDGVRTLEDLESFLRRRGIGTSKVELPPDFSFTIK